MADEEVPPEVPPEVDPPVEAPVILEIQPAIEPNVTAVVADGANEAGVTPVSSVGTSYDPNRKE